MDPRYRLHDIEKITVAPIVNDVLNRHAEKVIEEQGTIQKMISNINDADKQIFRDKLYDMSEDHVVYYLEFVKNVEQGSEDEFDYVGEIPGLFAPNTGVLMFGVLEEGGETTMVVNRLDDRQALELAQLLERHMKDREEE